METLDEEQVVKELDKMNQESFKYVGVLHIRSGYRPEVEAHKEFIDNLEVEPVKEFRIQPPSIKLPRDIQERCFTHYFYDYVNVYKFHDVKDKLKHKYSKYKCFVRLK